ncbi:putative protein OS=Tsukamurella paurometabola (strain ATCC 8368 / DSM / CCUG 35730 /CIP 100753 / JCM 10117 / KCTC 9821 / NBRC 16120 / NCIMB 702349/ NCTC 13040) OX=521096 GN=Tpau_2440 PE=4 SV=1 [Tsukamurella paurometabola]|uniref:Uncharacterized protein n=1 Tax=Tsukamurella paurometabola (strain ATCC 8368 / DSM 20162 / CCUG 35730 / CIP 100753 / JCM 10117 / KCTC 9821 / NBRC 16120 / NCIMB 702349 / NCTC 13040) TaxID=521096 RepID=D5UR56_TSUPD|nr:hypothetical protein [Tsukamurella paurometabola]ADG79045.1 conserved hypothetical protein [Tsukamurella paurometabola DSM 20162]SUP33879.1 Uncharacterised protein [Tsukamurella paurometabola]
MTLLSRRNVLAALAATAIAALSPVTAHAAGNAVPNYEVKLNLTTAALDGGAPSTAVKSTFGIGSSSTSLSYEYFDTDTKALSGEGWSVRLRHEAGKSLDLNYKKRFPVTNGDVDAALTTANGAGFDSSDTNYEAQVDWTYGKQTLSFANKKTSSSSGLSGTALPDSSTALALVVGQIPGKLENWKSKNWGKDTLQASRVHGPVTSKEWKGSWEGVKPAIEVLPMPGQTVIEFSFKADDRSTAQSLRQKAIDTLSAKGWLLPGDVLKTELILSTY